MDIKKLQETIVDALDDIKARDIAVFDTTKGTAEFDRVIIATADVARQTKAMAVNVITKVKEAGGRIVSMEGGDSGEWVLVDCADAIVHIMQPAVRQYYNLEELWGQRKVKVATAAEKAAEAAKQVVAKARAVEVAVTQTVKDAAQKLTKRGGGRAAATGKAPVKAASAKKLAAGKAVAKNAAAKKSSPKKAPARKSPATANVKKGVVRQVARKTVAPRKLVSKEVAPKKAAGGKPVAKKPATTRRPATAKARPRTGTS